MNIFHINIKRYSKVSGNSLKKMSWIAAWILCDIWSTCILNKWPSYLDFGFNEE